MRRFSEVCLNEKHYAWRSMSPVLVNIKAKFGSGSIFSRNLRKRMQRGKDTYICHDCVKTSWEKRDFTSQLPDNYKSLPAFIAVSINNRNRRLMIYLSKELYIEHSVLYDSVQ